MPTTPEDPSELSSPGRRVHRWQRDDGAEFDRIAFFSDAIYAIAMTLLALDLRIDHLAAPVDAPSSMFAALDDLFPKFVAYFVGFLLLARYWKSHHGFFGRLKAVDSRLLTLNLTYLGFVALLPFPTSLIGAYEENPISVVLFSLNMAIISGLETVSLRHAYRAGLMRRSASPAVQRWEITASLIPSVMFVVTIPLAFISPTLQLVSWLPIGIATSWWTRRTEPPGTPLPA